MSVSVAGRPIQQPGSLSDLGRLSLAFVDGGLEWLAWAVSSTEARYDFPDETTLLAQVQLGLHGSSMTLLPRLGLMVSPVKLMSLGPVDLPVLAKAEGAKAEGGDTSVLLTTQVRRILDDHRLLTQTDLQKLQTWLADLDVTNAPVLHAHDFLDRLALVRLMRDPLLAASLGNEAADLSREAAGFAVQQARTTQEFADYFRFYLAMSTKPGASAAGAQERMDSATQAMRALLPLFFGALDCPQVSGLPSPDEVGQAVSAWLSSGKKVGFLRLSEGLAQVALNTRFQNETGSAARQLVETYLSAAQTLLGAVRPRDGQLGQDGNTCTFALRSGDQQLELQLSPNGVISLREFGLLRGGPASPALAPPTDLAPQESMP